MNNEENKRELRQKYYQKNKKKINRNNNIYYKIYYQRNKGKITEKNIRNYYKNRLRRIKLSGIYQKAHPEQSRKSVSKSYYKNRQKRLDEAKAYRIKNKNILDEKRKIERLKRVYSMTLGEHEDMIKKQKNLCAICQKPNNLKRPLYIDHCHKTKKVRGLLCQKCNSALGFLGESVEIITSALNYISK